MKTKSLIILAAAVAATTACVKEQLSTPNLAADGLLRATVEGVDTRAGFDADGKFYWSDGDQLGVTTSGSPESFSALSLTAGKGTDKGTFEGSIEGTVEGYAVYPFGSHSLSETSLTYVFPESYVYTSVDQDFFSATQGEGNSFNPAMWGKIENGSVSMKHLGGVFCIKIPKMLASGKLTFSTDQQITGGVTTNLSASGEPALSTAGASSSNNSVTINFSGATADASGVFYVPVPTGNYTNVRIIVNNGSSNIIDAAAGDLKIERKSLKKIELREGSIDATPATTSDVENTLKSNDAVTVSDQIGSGAEITIPLVENADASKSIILNNIGSDASLTLNEASSDGASSVSDLTLSIPYDEISNTALDVTINLPNTTVTLAGNIGKADYGTVTASTADNTLILSSGVSVEEVVVEKGNIRVNNGASVLALTRAVGNTSTVTVYKEAGAIVPELGEGFVIEDAAVSDMKAVCANGGEYVLPADITGDFVISATENVTIDLNGHTITNLSGDTFTVNNGRSLTIKGSGTVDNVTHQKACIYNNGTVNLVGGTYTRSKEASTSTDSSNGNSYYNILNHGIMTISEGVAITSTGAFSSLIDNGYYNYTETTNPRVGYVEGTGHANPSLTINGGSFSGGINTIKNDDGATLVIKDGVFANTTQATVQNNNIAAINGGVFNPTGSAKDAVQSRYFNSGVNAGQTTITAGTFNGNLYTEGSEATYTITGGTFSDPDALQYLGDGANVEISLASDTNLSKSMVVAKGSATINLNTHTLTAASTALEYNSKVTAIAVKDGASLTVKNGKIGNAENAMWYGIYAYGEANVTLEDVEFSEMVTYAYNGKGKLTATGCVFRGWLSAWHYGGSFTDCTFTIGKEWYPAAICYGSTTFNSCSFFKNGTDADVYDDSGKPDSDGYYRCDYVVAACNPATTIDFNNCSFIDADNNTTDIAIDNHPYHACGWGDGKVADANIKVNGVEITSKCTDAAADDDVAQPNDGNILAESQRKDTTPADGAEQN